MTSPEPIDTPCIKVCVLVGEQCSGCLRTLSEIARWGAMTPEERRRIMDALAERRARLPSR